MADDLELVEVALEGTEEPKQVPGTPAEEVVEVEIDNTDPLYAKKDWKTDPAANEEDPNDGDYGPKVQKRIGKLRASLSEAAKQRDRANKELQDAINLSRAQMAKLAEYERMLQNGTAAYVERQAETEEGKAQLAQTKLRTALTQGDADAIAEANRELASSAAKAANLRQQAEARKAQIQQAPPVQQQQQFQQPVQQQQVVDEKANAWASENASWFRVDQEMTEAAFEIHDELAAAGVRLGSDTYYKTLNAKMREKFPTEFKVEQKRTNSPVSTTTRVNTTQQANQVKNGKVTLTQSQIATAKRLGLTAQQYAVQLVKLQKEGKY